ncbi:MAG: T9SS type A sorting domain-containing protein [Sphingobacteriales bacterium JAD_PAG50586_3]|nr:MAG: T9SS type A sorting domain-containing protein [Sphingobacteriales bacterium JAD_PAG50586_3]
MADSSWSTMLRNWGLNVDFAIFPIIDGTQTAINNQPVYNTTIYPNPAVDVVNIAVSGNTRVNLGIIDSNGKVVALYNNTNGLISINGLAKGVYYVVVDNGKRHGYAQKLIVQ